MFFKKIYNPLTKIYRLVENNIFLTIPTETALVKMHQRFTAKTVTKLAKSIKRVHAIGASAAMVGNKAASWHSLVVTILLSNLFTV